MNTNDFVVGFWGIRNKQRITCDWYLENKRRECLLSFVYQFIEFII